MSTISDGTTTFTPLLILGREHEREGRNVWHDILDRADPDVSLREAGTRQGTHHYLCEDYTHGMECDTLHKGAAIFTLTDTDQPDNSMTYALNGPIRFTLDTETLERVVVEVPFREVTP